MTYGSNKKKKLEKKVRNKMGYSRIKTNRKGVENMEFPLQGYCSQWIFWGLIKNNWEFLWVIKKKSCGISRGLLFRP